MSYLPIKDSADATRKVDVITRTEGADTVETQAVAVVNPATGAPIDLATQATVAALLTVAQAVQSAIESLNGKATTINTGEVAGAVSIDGESIGWWPGYSAPTATASKQFLFDEGNAAVIRGSVLTDEGTFRANFSGTSLAVSIGTVSVSGATVTGTNFILSDAHLKDYFKLDADPESAWTQILSMDSNTQITLIEPYKGAGTSGAASRAIIKPVTGSGGSISVASGNCTIASGTTSNAVTGLIRKLDFLPIVERGQFSISQRIANQTPYFGLQEDSTTPRWFARFNFTGTNSNQVICETGRSATGAPSGGEIQQVTITLPNALTTATSLEWRVELLPQSARFYVTNKIAGDTKPTLVADLSRVIPLQSDIVAAGLFIANGTSPASSTNIVVDYITGQNHNVLAVTPFSETENFRTDTFGHTETVLGDDIISSGSTTSGTPATLCTLDLNNCTGALFRYHTGGVSSTYTLIVEWSDDGVTNWGTVATSYPFINNNTTAFAGALGRTDTATATTATAPVVISTVKLARWVRFRCSAISLGQINAIGYGLRGLVPTMRVDLHAATTAVTLSSTSITTSATVSGSGTNTRIISAANTTGISVKASVACINSAFASNMSASWKYVKVYAKATAAVVGTDVTTFIWPLPPNSAFSIDCGAGIRIAAGLSIGITGGYADSDTTAPAAGDVILNLSIA